jgi:hypothetical protein
MKTLKHPHPVTREPKDNRIDRAIRELRWTQDQGRCPRTLDGAVPMGPAPIPMPASPLDRGKR